MLKFKTSCAVLANLSSNLLNEVGLSLFRYFEVGLRECDIVVNKYVRYLISWWVLVIMILQPVARQNVHASLRHMSEWAGDVRCHSSSLAVNSSSSSSRAAIFNRENSSQTLTVCQCKYCRFEPVLDYRAPYNVFIDWLLLTACSS